jgi:hypothetical protein
MDLFMTWPLYAANLSLSVAADYEISSPYKRITNSSEKRLFERRAHIGTIDHHKVARILTGRDKSATAPAHPESGNWVKR